MFYIGSLGENATFVDINDEACNHDVKSEAMKKGGTTECTMTDLNRLGQIYTCTVNEKRGIKAGNGGNGGRHGDPGLAGKIMLFQLDQKSNLKNHTSNGIKIIIFASIFNCGVY